MNRQDKKKIKKLNKVIADLQKEIENKKEGKTPKEQHDIENEIVSEMFLYWDEIDTIISRDLINDAKKFGVLLPDDNDKKMWTTNKYEKRILSQKGQILVKKEIRNENREKWKFIILCFSTFFSLIIGLLGAIIGIISVIND